MLCYVFFVCPVLLWGATIIETIIWNMQQRNSNYERVKKIMNNTDLGDRKH